MILLGVRERRRRASFSGHAALAVQEQAGWKGALLQAPPPGDTGRAMSQENVELVRELMRGFNDRDESVISHYAEDADYRLIGGFSGMAGQSIKGREAILQFAFELIENLGARFEVEKLFEANDRVRLDREHRRRRRGERCSHHTAVGPGLHVPRGQDHSRRQLLGRERGPRSRGAVGVADVAGERRGG